MLTIYDRFISNHDFSVQIGHDTHEGAFLIPETATFYDDVKYVIKPFTEDKKE